MQIKTIKFLGKKNEINKDLVSDILSVGSPKSLISTGSFYLEVLMNDVERMLHEYVFPFVVMTIALGVLLIGCQAAQAEEIDMDKIMMIESSGNPLAHNKKDNSIGLYQITPICLAEFNMFHKTEQYRESDLWNPVVNFKIADWYINNRIPKMLKYYKVEDTVENRIWAYNAGIGNVVKGRMPEITKNYIRKYRG